MLTLADIEISQQHTDVISPIKLCKKTKHGGEREKQKKSRLTDWNKMPNIHKPIKELSTLTPKPVLYKHQLMIWNTNIFFSWDRCVWLTYIVIHAIQCAVPESIHTHPKEGHWKFRGGGGSQMPKILKESMKLNWNYQGGGVQTKKPSVGGEDISGTT